MKRSKNATVIYKSLYMNPNENTVEDVHKRVASCIGNNENQIDEFELVLNDNIFRPNTPCLINARSLNESQNVEVHDNNLVACFVLPLEDSMESIMELWSTCAKIYAGGGGAGFCITNLREKDSPITAGGVASGPIEYLKVVQTISNTVKSGGKARRAANLASIWYKHPNVLDLITCKTKHDFSAINISVLVDDEFMNDVYNDNMSKVIDLISPNKNKIVGSITVKQLWDLIIDNAYLNGDPGLLFKTTANKFNPIPSYGEMTSSNPCGEVLLPCNSCCDLGSINLNKCVLNNEFNFRLLTRYSEIATDFLDNVIDKTSFPTKSFEEMMKKTRPIGIGLMGFADILYKLNIRYGSNESITLFENICKTITQSAFRRSIHNAEKLGNIDIPEIDLEHFLKYLRSYGLDNNDIEQFRKHGIRNLNVTSIAPTGSISISADCSYAFEPMMAIVWEKKLVDRNSTLQFINQDFINACEEQGIEVTDILKKQIIENKGSIQSLNFPKLIKDIFVTAHDISPEQKIMLQSAGQKYITLAISSTCNLPYSATKEDISNIYKLAWKNGLKGITVYRDGSYKDQPVSFGKSCVIVEPMILPSKRTGSTVKIKGPNGTIYITGNKVDGKLVEVFLAMGKAGQVETLLIDTLSKIISKSLQYHIPTSVILDQMEDEGGRRFWFKLDEERNITTSAESIVDGIAKVIKYHFLEEDVNGHNINSEIKTCETEFMDKCPECGKMTLQRNTGCRGGLCSSCGYAACG